MHSVVVNQWGETPQYVEVDDLQPPTDPKLLQLTVKATGLQNLVKGRVSGTHYSAKTLPHTLGVDGVGTSQDGQDYYFSTLVPVPGVSSGSYSDKVNVFKPASVPLPAGADPIQIAGLVNPGTSSWLALTKRTSHLPENFTVVILGVTSLSGKVAVHLAKTLGAGKVIGAARNQKAMDEIPGLDGTICFAEDPAQTDYSSLPKDGVDIILDYVYGPAFVALIKYLMPTPARPLQYVQIGTMATTETPFPADVLRFKDITIRGNGPGAWSPQQLGEELPKLIAELAKMRKMPLKEMKLKDVAEGWVSKDRVVFTP